MHLYCDESGGTDGELFCVSALRLDPRLAERALKSFRRRVGWEGEVKGHALDSKSRRLLLDLTFKTPGAAAVVVCDSRTSFGGWAASTLVPEARLRRELVVEACVLSMADVPGTPCAGVTIDGGRYTKAVLAEERAYIECVLSQLGVLTSPPHPRLVAHFPSEQHPGLQLTDVLANTVHRLLHSAEPGSAPDFSGLPDVLTERLQVRHASLTHRRPLWLGGPPY